MPQCDGTMDRAICGKCSGREVGRRPGDARCEGECKAGLRGIALATMTPKSMTYRVKVEPVARRLPYSIVAGLEMRFW